MEKGSDSYRWMKMDTQKQKYRKTCPYHPPPGLNLRLMSTFSQRGLSMSSTHEVMTTLKFCHSLCSYPTATFLRSLPEHSNGVLLLCLSYAIPSF